MRTNEIDRRTFLLSGLALATPPWAQSPALTTLSDWLAASRAERTRALVSLLEHIQATDRNVHAWVEVRPQPSTGRGSLAEIPFGVKDVIETDGMATEYGAAFYKGRQGTKDAAIVTMLRQRGAVLLGKVHTAAFAFRTPPPTRNPRDLDHTPGGSSSGSAAAVAANMVPLALGTQTAGSIMRPASYCGVTGFKPTYGRFSTEGVLPLAESLDTLGFFAHRPVDMLAFWSAIGQNAGRPGPLPTVAALDPLPDSVEAPMAQAYWRAIQRLRDQNVAVRSVDLAGMLATLRDAARTVLYYEGARLHQERFRTHADKLPELADLVRQGLAISESKYGEATRVIGQSRTRVAEMLGTTPVIVSPAATGPAPRAGESTGDASMNTPWTALRTPLISIPMPVGGALPLGLQMTAAMGQDALLLRAAVEVDRLLA